MVRKKNKGWYEKTIILIKPDAVVRNLAGTIIKRFEEGGLRVIETRTLFLSREMFSGIIPHTLRWATKVTKTLIRNLRRRGIDPAKFFDVEDEIGIAFGIIEEVERYLLSGPVTVVVLRGRNGIQKVRSLVGATSPKKARPGTIRGDFGFRDEDYDMALVAKRPCLNLVHAPDNRQEAERNLRWFYGLPRESPPREIDSTLYEWMGGREKT